jgi:hypothetical protein
VTLPMRFAYADPPYYGCCKLYDHFHGDDGRCWDDADTHKALIGRLCDDYPDGWAMSATSNSLQTLLPLCPEGVRIAAWTKPFAAFKKNVRVAYTWEPVIFWHGRTSSKDGAGVNRDHLAESIVMRKHFTGTKPEKFCRWVLDLLGWKPGDVVDDLFPGLGTFGRVLAAAEASPEILRIGS